MPKDYLPAYFSKCRYIGARGICRVARMPVKVALGLSNSVRAIAIIRASNFCGILYAPNAGARLSGKAGWFGSLVVKTATGSDDSAIHYDRSPGC